MQGVGLTACEYQTDDMSFLSLDHKKAPYLEGLGSALGFFYMQMLPVAFIRAIEVNR